MRYPSKKKWNTKKKPVTISKIQDGGLYTFHYESIHEAARHLRVTPTTVFKAFYCQHKCQTFEVSMTPKQDFDLTKFKV